MASNHYLFFKCEHGNEGSDIISHLSEKKIEKDFQKDNSKWYLCNLQYALHSLKLVVAHNALQLVHLIGPSKKVNRKVIYYAYLSRSCNILWF